MLPLKPRASRLSTVSTMVRPVPISSTSPPARGDLGDSLARLRIPRIGDEARTGIDELAEQMAGG